MKSARLTLVADDYAISPGVSAGIRALAERGRLNATGVMTLMPAWRDEAPALHKLRDKIAVGLHFTLTDQKPLGPMPDLAPLGILPSVGKLLLRSLAGLLSADEVAAELDRQLDEFEANFGQSPDFIDGHQHVHLFPTIWPVVLASFDRRLDRTRCWWRHCGDAGWWRRGCAAKAGLIHGLALAPARAARARGLRMNRGFSGFYDYGADGLAGHFAPMMRGAVDGHAMMVHPGHVDDALRAVDGLTAPRQLEWDYLAGEKFPVDLDRLGFQMAAPRFLIDDAGD